MELRLTRQEQEKLRTLVSASSNKRERERAQTILYFAAGLSAKEIQVVQRLHLETLYKRRKAWQSRGFASLQDSARSGAPPKLNEAHCAQLSQWAEQEALTAPGLLAKLRAWAGMKVHRNTLIATLRKKGFVWKRTRHSLKKNVMLNASSKHNKTLKGCWIGPDEVK